MGLVLFAVGCASFRPLPPAPQVPASGKPQTLAMIGTGPIDASTRERVTRQLIALGADNMLTTHLAAMQTVSDSPLIVGNRVQLLVDGPSAYQAMFAAIAAAREHVNIEMYIFDEAFHGKQKLSDLLIERVTHGVTINVLYDSVGSSNTPADFLERLKNAGVTLCAFNPLTPTSKTMEFTQRDHRKIVVVDGHRAFAGGINFSSTYSSSSRRRTAKSIDATKDGWRDTHIEVAGPVSAAMQRLFLESWTKQKCTDMPAREYVPASQDAGDTLLRLAAASADSRRNEPYLAALSAINAARHTVDLTMAYFAPDNQLEDAVRDAVQRGVRVRLLLSGLSDFNGIVEAGRAHYTRLLKAGVQIHEEQRVLLHAKTLEVDGIWSTIGSANWDWISFAHNDELNVEVIDKGFAARMRELFESDLARATPITLSEWRKRPLSRKLRERFWVMWERVL
ncbi:MAG: phospholipase D-like domain-containing protein [Steroidobacteraceae bacterium]